LVSNSASIIRSTMATTTPTCPFCGQEILEARSQFCGNCGRSLGGQFGTFTIPPPNRRNILRLGAIGAAGAMALAVIGTTALLITQQHHQPVVLLLNPTVTPPSQIIHQKWSFPTRSAVDSSPTAVNGILYIGSTDSSIYAIDTATGLQKWSF